MKIASNFIYVLRLQNSKYYVGSSNDVDRRFQEHQNGRGSAWTRLYPPIEIQNQYRVEPGRHTALEEDVQVKHMMLRHGIENVRGGSYCNVQLFKIQSEELQDTFRHAKSECFRCGQHNHFASQCNAKREAFNTAKAINGLTKENRQSLTSRTPSRSACERCGRNSHSSDRCYATFHVNGSSILAQRRAVNAISVPPETVVKSKRLQCEKCGRTSHTADRCFAKYDVNGVFVQHKGDTGLNFGKRPSRGGKPTILDKSDPEAVGM